MVHCCIEISSTRYFDKLLPALGNCFALELQKDRIQHTTCLCSDLKLQRYVTKTRTNQYCSVFRSCKPCCDRKKLDKMILKLFILSALLGIFGVAAKCKETFERCADKYVTIGSASELCSKFRNYLDCLTSGCELTTGEQRAIQIVMARSSEIQGVKNCDIDSSTIQNPTTDCDATFEKCNREGQARARGATRGDVCRLAKEETDCVYTGCTFLVTHKEVINSLLEVELENLDFDCDLNNGQVSARKLETSTLFLLMSLMVLRNFVSEF
ncbi:hypothetical protein RRG08_033026 [Elysia crispata]|uniref:Uncharacterized protein n=1 Tax=Elysia crispata TaxID=231223 RepID=A0AAE1ADN9_9GAST|nr:hypothetical protein RRG08_033026 [Elysia crispata]